VKNHESWSTFAEVIAKKLAYFILRHRGVFSAEKLLISYEIEKAVSQFALSDSLATFMPVA